MNTAIWSGCNAFRVSRFVKTVLETSIAKGYAFDDFREDRGYIRVGYARVSTTDQSAELQLDALRRAGCEKVFTEKASGARDDRPELARILEYVLGVRQPPGQHLAGRPPEPVEGP